jgi:hypothetical protein
MLIRLVRMTFRPAARDDFLAIFEESSFWDSGVCGL